MTKQHHSISFWVLFCVDKLSLRYRLPNPLNTLSEGEKVESIFLATWLWYKTPRPDRTRTMLYSTELFFCIQRASAIQKGAGATTSRQCKKTTVTIIASAPAWKMFVNISPRRYWSPLFASIAFNFSGGCHVTKLYDPFIEKWKRIQWLLPQGHILQTDAKRSLFACKRNEQRCQILKSKVCLTLWKIPKISIFVVKFSAENPTVFLPHKSNWQGFGMFEKLEKYSHITGAWILELGSNCNWLNLHCEK